MKRFVSTVVVFGVGVLISYFLSDFYNDINDDNRTNFSRQESITLVDYIDDAIEGEEREFMYSNVMKSFHNMTLVDYRNIGSLPGKPPLILDERPQEDLDAFIFIRRVFNNDRVSFEERMSREYNKTLFINDYDTGVPIEEEREVYWPVFYHIVTANIIGGDILTEPGRLAALNNILETGEVSYSPPVLSVSRGTTSFLKIYELLTTPEGDLGAMSLFVNLQRVVEEKTNVLEFLEGGNGGRKIIINQIQDGVTSILYERGTADDLLYEEFIPKTSQTTFSVHIFDNFTYDNEEETLIFMGIGILVSLVLAIWEWLRSGASIKAIETSVAKAKFLANISHEIRTPINGIVGISDILSKEILPPLPKRYVNIIVSCSSSLLSLLNNVLDMSKINAGKMEQKKNKFILRTLVLKTLRDSWGVVHAKNPGLGHICAIFTKRVPDTEILGNETHIFQILNNLVSNASKFTEEGYIEVKIDAKQVEHGKFNKKDQIEISMAVRDTGCGMSAESISKLFRPFSQVHGSTSQEGTGLGLLISMNLSKNMGGSISCESEIGVGTTFTSTFILPGVIKNDNSDDETVLFEPNVDIEDEFIGLKSKIDTVNVLIKEGTNFLVVDDNKLNQLVIKQMLESIGAKNIDLASDGKDSINMSSCKKYDIIFMDKFMPVMGGVEATEIIRKDSKNLSHKSPILFLSADVQDESISECIASGANDFVGKPYKMDILVDKIYKVASYVLYTETETV